MKPLRLPDRHQVRAAQGWLELGNHLEANEELEKITPQFRSHPDVLKVRCQIYTAAKKWEAVCDISSALTKLVPDDPLGWLEGSEALHQLDRTAEARDTLLQVMEKFPSEVMIRYNLARYEARLGTLQPAGDHLSQAFVLSQSPKIKLKALEEPDFEPLWREHGITWEGDIRAKPVDLAAKPRGSPVITFATALLFWAIAAAGLAWKAGANTRAGFSDAGLSAAGGLFSIGLFLFLSIGLGTVPALNRREKLPAAQPLSPILRFVVLLLLAGVVGAAVSLCCRLRLSTERPICLRVCAGLSCHCRRKMNM